MSTLFKNFRKLFEQAWLPIFVQDNLDTELLLAGCRLAGIDVMEYTLRRKDVKDVIPTLKSRVPGMTVLMGSTIDDETIVNGLKEKHPQIMTISELAPYVDGFVSMLPYSDETLIKYASTHICIPAAETCGEALRQMKSGAAYIKLLGPDFAFSKRLHALPTFQFCPTYITGGITKDRMEEAFSAGNTLCAAGFDVVLKGENPDTLTPEKVAECIVSFVETAKQARCTVYPELQGIEKVSDKEFCALLPNFSNIRPEE